MKGVLTGITKPLIAVLERIAISNERIAVAQERIASRIAPVLHFESVEQAKHIAEEIARGGVYYALPHEPVHGTFCNTKTKVGVAQ